MGKIVMVTGGARSGKSAFAERYAASVGPKVVYVATAQPLDREMEVRVAAHQARRPESWTTEEAPLDPAAVLAGLDRGVDAVLLDCLTLFVTNLMFSPSAPEQPEDRRKMIQENMERLLIAAREAKPTVILVTNETGLGIVPDNAVAREFRDLAGLANQQAAAVSDEVYMVVSGLAVELRRLAVVPGEEGNG